MKKWSLADICAYLSLGISITLLVLWCYNVGGFTVVSLDSFVGVIVALLAIVVTLAVGWQIYNSIELKNRIKELDSLKEDFLKQQESIEQLSYKSKHHIMQIWGVSALRNEMPIDAFRAFIISLDGTLHQNHPVNVELLLNNMESSVAQIKQGSVCPTKYHQIITESDVSIRNTNNFDMIERRYNNIYGNFSNKIKVDEQ